MNLRQKNTENSRGQVLLSVLVASVIGIMALYFMASGTRNLNRYQRGITASDDLDQAAASIHLFIDSRDACLNSGLIGLDVAPLFNPSPSPVPVVLSLQNTAGAEGHLAYKAGIVLGTTRKVETFNLVSLSATSASSGAYIATLDLKSSIVGTALTSKSPSKRFLLNLVLDPSSHKVVSCGSADPGENFCSAIVGGVWDSTLLRCRIGVEARTNDPEKPTQGQMWLRTDL